MYPYQGYAPYAIRVPSGISFRQSQLQAFEKRKSERVLAGRGSPYMPVNAVALSVEPVDDQQGSQVPSQPQYKPWPSISSYVAPSPHIEEEMYLPMVDVKVDVDVMGTIAKTTVRQSFRNISPCTIKEATYQFPLYDGTAVVSMRCQIGEDRVLEGVVKPKTTAQAEFEEAKETKRTAALIEEHTPEIFETSLSNLPSDTLITVEIGLINELKADIGGQGLLLTIPTSVAPRYGTPPMANSLSKRGDVTKGELQILVNVSASVPIQKLESRTHPISVGMGIEKAEPAVVSSFGDLAAMTDISKDATEQTAADSRLAHASLSESNPVLDRDFVLLILGKGSSMLDSRAVLAPPTTEDGEAALMLSLNPRTLFASFLELSVSSKTEIILIADCSGSMSGTEMEALRRALQILLKSMPSENIQFNIYPFGSTFRTMWGESRPYTQDNLEEAARFVSTIDADMGGTEILAPMQEAVRQAEKSNHSTQIILLTDGETWHTPKILDFVKQSHTESNQTIRFFALGIGSQVSHALVEGIGRFGGGFAEVVATDGHWEGRIIRLLKGALIQDRFPCRIEMHGKQTTSLCSWNEKNSPMFVQAPYILPPLHPFSRRSVYMLFHRPSEGYPTSIIVKSNSPSGAVIEVSIPVETITEGATLHHLAAKAIVRDLQSKTSWMHSRMESEQRLPNEAVSQFGEYLAMRYHITSPWTSFIALEKKTNAENMSRLYRALQSAQSMPEYQPYPRTGYSSQRRVLESAQSVPQNQLYLPPLYAPAQSSSGLPTNGMSDTSPMSYIPCSHSLISSEPDYANHSSSSFSPPSRSEPTLYRPAPTSYRPAPESPSHAASDRLQGIECDSFAQPAFRSYEHSSFEMSTEWSSSLGPVPTQERRAKRGRMGGKKKMPTPAPTDIRYVEASEPDQNAHRTTTTIYSLNSLIECQYSSGRFQPSAEQEKMLQDHYDSSKFLDSVSDASTMGTGSLKALEEPTIAASIFLTMACIHFIKVTFPDDSELWELVIAKAERWVARQVPEQEVRERIFQLVEDSRKDSPIT